MGGPPPRKTRKLADEEDEADHAESDHKIAIAMNEIDDIQTEVASLAEKAYKEVIEVEIKYNKLRKPFYDRRASKIDWIPNFWVSSVLNHPEMAKIVTEDEDDCLQFLNKLEVEEFENITDGFRIKFTFDEENPFFENIELVKEFHLGRDVEPKSTSTEIKWIQGLDLSKTQDQIIMARRKRGLSTQTFFSWFSDNTEPTNDSIAEAIKDDLWPSPLQYYLAVDADESDSDDSDDQGFSFSSDSEDDNVKDNMKEAKEEPGKEDVGGGTGAGAGVKIKEEEEYDQ